VSNNTFIPGEAYPFYAVASAIGELDTEHTKKKESHRDHRETEKEIAGFPLPSFAGTGIAGMTIGGRE
tara:strand:+ start:578 stop:781 length:204 start_codon:yes stop_codon:yes gene_type:complete